jgi:hypothetical protein
VDLFIELQMMTLAANLLVVVRNSNKPRCINTPFGPTMVAIVDERILRFTSITKGIYFAVVFSMQRQSIPFMLRTIFNHFAGLLNTTVDTLVGTHASGMKELT